MTRRKMSTSALCASSVREIILDGVKILQRRNDNSLNATEILKLADFTRGRRIEIGRKYVSNGKGKTYQGGLAKLQGTWVSHNDGLRLLKLRRKLISEELMLCQAHFKRRLADTEKIMAKLNRNEYTDASQCLEDWTKMEDDLDNFNETWSPKSQR